MVQFFILLLHFLRGECFRDVSPLEVFPFVRDGFFPLSHDTAPNSSRLSFKGGLFGEFLWFPRTHGEPLLPARHLGTGVLSPEYMPLHAEMPGGAAVFIEPHQFPASMFLFTVV